MSKRNVWFRPHRALFATAMAEKVQVDCKKALRKHLLETMGDYLKFDGKLTVEKYGDKPDERNGWITHIVLWDGTPVGFTSNSIK